MWIKLWFDESLKNKEYWYLISILCWSFLQPFTIVTSQISFTLSTACNKFSMTDSRPMLEQSGLFVVCLITPAVTLRTDPFISKLFTAGHKKPMRLSSATNHQETHQLEGQYFVGSRVIYNLLKVGSNCNSHNNKKTSFVICSGHVNSTRKQYFRKSVTMQVPFRVILSFKIYTFLHLI